jgi:hypothetical protein
MRFHYKDNPIKILCERLEIIPAVDDGAAFISFDGAGGDRTRAVPLAFPGLGAMQRRAATPLAGRIPTRQTQLR